ncbi:MAG: hypothetical protein JXK05_09810 [Campylobacterales bacterium]|nr:hypothetical protein [Campylobacterales bacterium]
MNLEPLRHHSITLLGKCRALERDEFDKLLGLWDITFKDSFDDEVALVVEGRMMNPYEQAEAARLYAEHKAQFVSIEEIERALCSGLDGDRLLMSLKLSNDQARLRRFIQNPYIDDALFLRLLRLYRWGGEGLFESDANRDVTAALIGRFYGDTTRNHNVQYAATGLVHLLVRTDDAALLETLCTLEPITALWRDVPQSGVWRTLLETLCVHRATPLSLIARALRSGDEGILGLLAGRDDLDAQAQQTLFTCTHASVREALACNAALDDKRFDAILRDAALRALMAAHVRLDTARFEALLPLEKRALGLNAHLDEVMVAALMDEGLEVRRILGANPALSHAQLDLLAQEEDAALNAALALNPSCDAALLDRLSVFEALHVSLAANPASAPSLLERLFATGRFEVLEQLSANPATPVALLYQLQLDARLRRKVSTNPAFGAHIQTQNIGWL